jgi:hypothetical protein
MAFSCGQVTQGGCPPRVPTDPYVHTLAHTVPQVPDSLDKCPPGLLSVNVSLTRYRSTTPSSCFLLTVLKPDVPLSFTGSLRVIRFPCFNGTIRTLRLPAAHPAALRFLRLAVPWVRLCSFLPTVPTPDRRPGVIMSDNPKSLHNMETTGSPTFPGNPNCAYALFFDPGRTACIRPL